MIRIEPVEDLKHPEGRRVFLNLVAHADVVVDNYRPGVARRLGIDSETLCQVKPHIICCNLSAFGARPRGERPVYDLVVQAVGGGMSHTGEPRRPPVRMKLPIGDLAGGIDPLVQAQNMVVEIEHNAGFNAR